ESDAQRLRNPALLDRFSGRSDGSHLTPGEAASEPAKARADRENRTFGSIVIRSRWLTEPVMVRGCSGGSPGTRGRRSAALFHRWSKPAPSARLGPRPEQVLGIQDRVRIPLLGEEP